MILYVVFVEASRFSERKIKLCSFDNRLCCVDPSKMPGPLSLYNNYNLFKSKMRIYYSLYSREMEEKDQWTRMEIAKINKHLENGDWRYDIVTFELKFISFVHATNQRIVYCFSNHDCFIPKIHPSSSESRIRHSITVQAL